MGLLGLRRTTSLPWARAKHSQPWISCSLALALVRRLHAGAAFAWTYAWQISSSATHLSLTGSIVCITTITEKKKTNQEKLGLTMR